MDYLTEHNCSSFALVCKFILSLSLALKRDYKGISTTAVVYYFLDLKYLHKHYVSKINIRLMVTIAILSHLRTTTFTTQWYYS